MFSSIIIVEVMLCSHGLSISVYPLVSEVRLSIIPPAVQPRIYMTIINSKPRSLCLLVCFWLFFFLFFFMCTLFCFVVALFLFLLLVVVCFVFIFVFVLALFCLFVLFFFLCFFLNHKSSEYYLYRTRTEMVFDSSDIPKTIFIHGSLSLLVFRVRGVILFRLHHFLQAQTFYEYKILSSDPKSEFFKALVQNHLAFAKGVFEKCILRRKLIW